MLKSNGRRNTKQRQAVLAAVRELGNHPTAEQVYEVVRKQLPGTSISTVYRNLGILSEQGMLRTVTGLGREVHYDHNTGVHSHVKCSSCGRICDVMLRREDMPRLTEEWLCGYILEGISINFIGKCPECAEREEIR